MPTSPEPPSWKVGVVTSASESPGRINRLRRGHSQSLRTCRQGLSVLSVSLLLPQAWSTAVEVTEWLLTQLLYSCKEPLASAPTAFYCLLVGFGLTPRQQLNFSLSLFLSLDKPPGLPYPLTFGEIISLPFLLRPGPPSYRSLPTEPWLTVPLLGSLPLQCCPQCGPASLPLSLPHWTVSCHTPIPLQSITCNCFLPGDSPPRSANSCGHLSCKPLT